MRLHSQCSVNKSGQHVNCSLSRALVVFAPHTAGVCDGPKHRAEIRTSCWKLHLACVHPCPKQLISFRSGRVDVFDRQMTERHRDQNTCTGSALCPSSESKSAPELLLSLLPCSPVPSRVQEEAFHHAQHGHGAPLHLCKISDSWSQQTFRNSL